MINNNKGNNKNSNNKENNDNNNNIYNTEKEKIDKEIIITCKFCGKSHYRKYGFLGNK